MIVPGVLGGLNTLTSPFKQSERFDVKAAARKLTANLQSQLSTPTAAMRSILSQYDMTAITPNSFANLVQQLSAKGTISSKDAQQLSSIPVDLANAGVSPDEKVNLLDFYQQQIAKVQETAAQSPNATAAQANFSQLVGRMQWVAKFAAVRQQGAPNGVNAVA